MTTMSDLSKVRHIVKVAAPVRKIVEQNLRDAIISGEFPPGAHLVDRELCDMFAVSRTVVREAQRSLEAEGLVVILPHKGVFVRQIEYDEAIQIYEVRKVLEALAGELCAVNGTPEEIAQLRAIYEELKATAADPSKLNVNVKTRFYAALLRGAKNVVLERMLNQLLNYNTQLRVTSLSEPGRLPQMIKEIGLIVEAIENREPQKAWKACLAHVEKACQAATRVLRQREEEGLTAYDLSR